MRAEVTHTLGGGGLAIPSDRDDDFGPLPSPGAAGLAPGSHRGDPLPAPPQFTASDRPAPRPAPPPPPPSPTSPSSHGRRGSVRGLNASDLSLHSAQRARRAPDSPSAEGVRRRAAGSASPAAPAAPPRVVGAPKSRKWVKPVLLSAGGLALAATATILTLSGLGVALTALPLFIPILIGVVGLALIVAGILAARSASK